MKSKIRVLIETILKEDWNTIYIDSRVNGNYRMKICRERKASNEEIKAILALPHVIKANYSRTVLHCIIPLYHNGICIYFDCKPSLAI